MARKKNKSKTAPPLSDAQRAALRAIRWRRGWFWTWALSYLPIGYTVMRAKWKAAFLAFIVVWTAALAVSVIRLRTAKCPRCGALFHTRRTEGGWSPGMTLGRRCLNCGLAIDADRVRRRG